MDNAKGMVNKMPPKVRITKEMIIEAAFEIAREDGIERVNAKTVSERLHCSTQPVMYCFKTIEELKAAVYEKADLYHSEFLMNTDEENPLMGIGLNYIQFAAGEKNLFKLLFQTGGIKQKNMEELMNAEELNPMIEVLQQEVGVDEGKARKIFETLVFFTHGYASLLANNAISYDEESIVKLLDDLFQGACATQMMKMEEEKNA
ncbi:MAG: TetR/AcrR family transcriptional regulator [Eubacteriales bacterium]|nr:TetR/AcrR family transcriptional regulator [Eubacteriales bacterium]